MNPMIEQLQNKQRLAMALMGNRPQASGPMGALSSLASALMGAKMHNDIGGEIQAEKQRYNTEQSDFLQQALLGNKSALTQLAPEKVALYSALSKQPERKTIKAADGFTYYQDTGERVLPNVQAKPEALKQPFQAVDVNGMPGFYQMTQNGPQRMGDIMPIPKSPTVFEQTGPNGTTRVSFGGTPGKSDGGLDKSNKRNAEAEIMSAMKSLDRLDSISRNYDPSYLTYSGQIQDWFSRTKEKFGGELDPASKQRVVQKRKFTQAVNTEFNAYRKLITGAAAAVQELEALKKAMLADDLSPTEFESAYSTYREELKRTVRINRMLIREGIMPGTDAHAARVNEMWVNRVDDDPMARGEELEQSGLNDSEVIEKLKAEGYI